MCGRFTLTKPVRILRAVFDAEEPPAELRPRYNVAPSQLVAVVGLKKDGVTRGITSLPWGMTPNWSNDGKPGPVNARSDSVNKPTFRKPFRSQRCLIPADGYYEWSGTGKKKQPYYFRMRDESVFAFAGLWDAWTDGERKVTSCCFVTCDANAVAQPIHDRMPVIVPRDSYVEWLAPATSFERIVELLRPYPPNMMEAFPVSTLVNSPKHESPDCIVPVEVSA